MRMHNAFRPFLSEKHLKQVMVAGYQAARPVTGFGDHRRNRLYVLLARVQKAGLQVDLQELHIMTGKIPGFKQDVMTFLPW